MKNLILYLFLLTIIPANAQDMSSIPVKLLSNAKATTQRFLGVDSFGWEYTIADNELRKQKDGKNYKYRSVSLGEINRVDLQNPLQIVLFYKKFNSVVLLDNQLNETSRINFSDLTQPLIAEAVGLAAQNRLWLYDMTTQQLGLYDLAKGSFKTITPPFAGSIKQYYNDYNFFYWIDAANKYYMVNLFGKVVSLGSVPDYDTVQIVSASELIVQKGNQLFLYNPDKQTQTPITIVEKSFQGFHYTAQILTIFTDSEINSYKITLPK